MSTIANYCPNCHAPLASEARFCNRCGVLVNADLTHVAQRLPPETSATYQTQATSGDLEPVVLTKRPTLFFIMLGYAAPALSALFVTALAAYFGLPAFYSLLLALPLLLIPASYHLRRNSVVYTLTPTKLETKQGLLSQTIRNIPIHNIRNVTVSATLPQRLLNLGDIAIDNSVDVGKTILIRNISNPRRYADLLLKQLRR